MIERIRGEQLRGKVIVSEEKGKKFGEVADVTFVSETGELMNLIVGDPNDELQEKDLETDEKGRILVPFSAVRSVGDFVIVSEKEFL